MTCGTAFHGLWSCRFRIGVIFVCLASLATAVPVRAQNASVVDLIRQGNTLSANDRFLQAIDRYRQAEQLALDAQAWPDADDAGLNIARAMLDLNRGPEAGPLLQDLEQRIRSRPQTPLRHSLGLGELLHRADLQMDQQKYSAQAQQWLEAARSAAQQGGDERSESLAVGTLGSIAEQHGQLDAALANSRIAAFLAENAGALDLLYKWQWQSARVLEALDHNAAAVAAYRQALDTLTVIRPALSRGASTAFNREVAPLFFDMASLLLEQTDQSETAALKRSGLSEVRTTIERFKAAEVRDYFDDECVIGEETEVDLASLSPDVAVVYPIQLDQQLEVLIGVGPDLRRHSIPISSGELRRTALDFRRALMSRQPDSYKASGKKLYSWLIEPALKALRDKSVDTLVMVPDGPLRNIPAAALWDGERFLVEEFAVATSLGLSLTNPQPITTQDLEVFAGGLSVEVAGMEALPGVRRELQQIGELFGGTQLMDAQFTLGPLTRELSEGTYNVVHIATHGKFAADFRDSFLQTYDGRLTLNTLEQTVGQRRYLSSPVELLMLSACETAVGDDRAALGLAGIALKAGVRSAVATLWPVSDAATSQLVGEFYTQLKGARLSKAQALRAAQIKLIKSENFGHPFSWSPYLMLGNWL